MSLNQTIIDFATTESVSTHFRVFYHSKSCCPKRVEIRDI